MSVRDLGNPLGNPLALPKTRGGKGMDASVGDVVFVATDPGNAWLPADGRSVKISEYPALFEVFGGDLSNIAFTKMIDPTDLPVGTLKYVTMSPDTQHLAITYAPTGAINYNIKVYQRQGESFASVSDISTNNHKAWSPRAFFVTNNRIMIGETSQLYDVNGSYIGAYPNGNYYYVTISQDSTYAIMYTSYASSNRNIICRWDSSSNTATDSWTVGVGSRSVREFSPDTLHAYVSSETNLNIYRRASSSSWVEITTLTQNGNTTSISTSGNNEYLAVRSNAAPYVTVYRRNGNTYTKLPDIADVPSWATITRLTHDGKFLILCGSSYPYMNIYRRDGDYFTQGIVPSIMPNDSITFTQMSSDGRYFSVGGPNFLMNYSTHLGIEPDFFVPNLHSPLELMENIYPPTLNKSAYIKAKL